MIQLLTETILFYTITKKKLDVVQTRQKNYVYKKSQFKL